MYSSFFAIERLPLDYTGEKKWNEHLTGNLWGAKCFQRVPLAMQAIAVIFSLKIRASKG
jgi:hypothetical protein